ncbi:MAG: hypothetical protein ACXVCE_12720 [Bacteriovorax sp.]
MKFFLITLMMLVGLHANAKTSQVSIDLCPSAAENSENLFLSRSFSIDKVGVWTLIMSNSEYYMHIKIDGNLGGLVSLSLPNSQVIELGKVVQMPKITDHCSSYEVRLNSNIEFRSKIHTSIPFPSCSLSDGIHCGLYREFGIKGEMLINSVKAADFSSGYLQEKINGIWE